MHVAFARWHVERGFEDAKGELGFVHEPVRAYVDRFVACVLANPPTDRPAGYLRRPEEIRLASNR